MKTYALIVVLVFAFKGIPSYFPISISPSFNRIHTFLLDLISFNKTDKSFTIFRKKVL